MTTTRAPAERWASVQQTSTRKRRSYVYKTPKPLRRIRKRKVPGSIMPMFVNVYIFTAFKEEL
jgi:hypothetical protein